MSEFKFTCPNCQQSMQATSEHSGLQINCPSCQTLLVIPTLPDAPAAPSAPPPGGSRLSKAAPPPPNEPHPAAAPPPPRMVRKKKPKTPLILGLVGGAAAVAAAIYFWPALMKKVSHGNQTIAAAEMVPTNAPPPPPPELSTEEILQKVGDTYKGLVDYAAKGRTDANLDMSSIYPSQKNVHIGTTSSLQLGRTNNYRLEWEQSAMGATSKGAAWNSGKGNFVGYGPYKPNKVKSRQEALTPAASAFLLSPEIAELFFSTTNSFADDAKDFTKTNSPSPNGQPCYVLTGEVNHQSILLWISKDSFLIFQIEVDLGGTKLDEAALKKLPAAQRNAAKMLAKIKGSITESYDSIQTNQNLLASAFETSYQATGNPAAARRPRPQRPSSMAGQLTQPRRGRPQP